MIVVVVAIAALLVGLVLVEHAGRVEEKIDHGFASWWQLHRRRSKAALRRRARITRPSLAGRGDVPASELGVALGRRSAWEGRRLAGAVGIGMRLYALFEEVILVIAPPRKFKTAWIGGAVLDAPGPVVATSTKVDLFRQTVRLRARRGPVHVFNPEGLGRVRSTLRWSPIAGCEHPKTAIRRAAYLLAGTPSMKGTDERTFWEGSKSKVLRCLLMAAAIGDKNMVDLHSWIATKSKEPLGILQSDVRAPRSFVEPLKQVLLTEADKTLDSIYMTLELTFAFMADPAIARTVCPGPGERHFDAEAFVRRGGTLYLIGEEDQDSSIAPVFTALTGHLFQEAKRISQEYPGGRLDPPLTLALDEAALICPVPLARWSADAGGRGIALLVCVQGTSQLEERWGKATATTIWNNAGVTMMFGGIKDDRTLETVTRLCDRRAPATESTGPEGKRSTSQNPVQRTHVLTPAQLRMLPDRRAIIVPSNDRPIIVQIKPAWERADVRRDEREAKRRGGGRPQPTWAPRGREGLATIVPMPARDRVEEEDAYEAEGS